MEITQKVIDALEGPYKERLDSGIIAELAHRLDVDAVDAMGIYYNSKLAHQIADGAEGIEYLSPVYLVDDLLEHEPELFRMQ